MSWKTDLEMLGWTYVGSCGTCGGNKHSFRRGNDTLTAFPNRNLYVFTENGKFKNGTISGLPSLIDELNKKK